MAADMPHNAGAITELLCAVERGDSLAQTQLWNLVYDELRRLAHQQMAFERRGTGPHTTMLVHEAYLRLFGEREATAHWENRRHFFAAAAKSMRRIRVDDARTRARLKRGGPGNAGERRHLAGLRDGHLAAQEDGHLAGQEARECSRPVEPVEHLGVCDDDSLALLALDEALTKLEQVDARKAEVVMLRFFAGLTVDQTAATMGIAPRTVNNLWRVARAWLHRELDGDRT